MYNKFNKIMDKAYKAYSITTAEEKIAFRSFAAEACIELAGEGKGILPDRAMLDAAWIYAREIGHSTELEAEGWGPQPRDGVSDAVRQWIEWEVLPE